MIHLHYWTTPNGHKIAIFLEEAGIPYAIHPVNISQGDQFKSDFLAISPNNKIPAIVDGDNSIFESGAILWYLAEKYQAFVPKDLKEKLKVSEWLFWQVGGLGPMLGQNGHFTKFAPEKVPYAIERFKKESERLFGVFNKHLEQSQFAANEYSIADMAIYPWMETHKMQGIDIENYPHVKRWLETIKKRPAVIKAYEVAKQVNPEFGK